MMYKSIFTFFIIFITSSCGFSVVKNYERDFNFLEINTSGDKRINYIIKNKLKVNSDKNKSKDIIINIESSKNKIVKEKNIENEITKYEITINVDIIFEIIDNGSKEQFLLNKTSDYQVENQHTQTLNNEKKIIRNLSESIADDILNEITRRINDL